MVNWTCTLTEITVVAAAIQHLQGRDDTQVCMQKNADHMLVKEPHL